MRYQDNSSSRDETMKKIMGVVSYISTGVLGSISAYSVIQDDPYGAVFFGTLAAIDCASGYIFGPKWKE